MRLLVLFLAALFLAAPAPAQRKVDWHWPASDYVEPGQDEIGFARWLRSDPANWREFKRFESFLIAQGVADVVPSWQLTRTASDWRKCNASAFEVPPETFWVNIVRTLRFTKNSVLPTTGDLDAVSVYRNPHLNSCAGGSARSAHRSNFAIDFVPRWNFERGDLMRRLCAVHRRDGQPLEIGFGFYQGIRFHLDNAGYRLWGIDPELGGAHCRLALAAREAARDAQAP
ncbi:hypothetical protein [Sphingomicrobium nitratireducens]|uniref:hypothetical protein n=1 Tax=Sphingomicrobium nitratireducens TaxID=2964666 RepID=UPI002240872A|nr:hypothetical protein [Sphingomicrobium nitratireducens]